MDPSIRLTIEVTLPCGHVLKTGHNCITGKITNKNLVHSIEFAGQCFEYFIRHRAKNHRCELVSAENPHGLLPQNQRQRIEEHNPMNDEPIA